MQRYTVDLHSEEETRRLGARLGRLLPDGAVVAIDGPLGAGKTRLVQGLAAACGVDQADVVSPTFTLVHEYRGERPVYHFDFYRLRDDDEFWALGPDEYFAGRGICVIEWAAKVETCLPVERLHVALTPLSETARHAQLTAFGSEYETVIRRLANEP